MLVMTWYGHRQRLRYNWFCYLFPSLVALQILIQGGSVLRLWQMSTYEYSWYSMSVLPGAALLLYTLVSQMQLGRQREKRALMDIDQLKQTERERLEHTVAVTIPSSCVLVKAWTVMIWQPTCAISKSST